MSERRTSARKKSFLQGRVFFNNGRNSVDCLVRDISEQGARLSFGGSVTIPEVVELRIPNKDENYRANVRWRFENEVGVAFDVLTAPPLAPSPDAGAVDVVERIHQLEKTVAALQRKLNELQANRRQREGEEM